MEGRRTNLRVHGAHLDPLLRSETSFPAPKRPSHAPVSHFLRGRTPLRLQAPVTAPGTHTPLRFPTTAETPRLSPTARPSLDPLSRARAPPAPAPARPPGAAPLLSPQPPLGPGLGRRQAGGPRRVGRRGHAGQGLHAGHCPRQLRRSAAPAGRDWGPGCGAGVRRRGAGSGAAPEAGAG